MISREDRKVILEAYRELSRVLRPGVYSRKTPHIQQAEAKFRAVVERLNPPSIGQLKSTPSSVVSWDMADAYKWVREIISQINEECPDLEWAQNLSVTDEFIVNNFTPGILLYEGVWISLTSQIDDRARIIPPVLIGNNCVVASTALIGPYSAVRNHKIEESWVILSSLGIEWPRLFGTT